MFSLDAHSTLTLGPRVWVIAAQYPDTWPQPNVAEAQEAQEAHEARREAGEAEVRGAER